MGLGVFIAQVSHPSFPTIIHEFFQPKN